MKIVLRAWLIFAFGLLLSGFLAKYQSDLNLTRTRETLKSDAAEVEFKLRQRMSMYEYGLRGARGAVSVTWPAINRPLFRRYAEGRDIDKEFPGARGFGFIRRVPANRLDDFLALARADGAPEFAIRQFSPSDAERYVIQYIEPVERNRPL